MIYCVEDERNIRELLVYTLETTGFEAIGIQEGKELFRCLEKELPDLILLDIMLPGQDGYSILEKLKKDPKTRDIPVIMVTAKEAEYDKVRGLDSGADDYITKPFGMMEFISRVKAVLRRSKKQMKDTLLNCGNLSIDVERHRVLDGERQVDLTYKEFELLKLFLSNPGTAFTRDKLMEEVWSTDYCGETRTVDMHVKTLRRKLAEAAPGSEEAVATVRGVGYRLKKNAS